VITPDGGSDVKTVLLILNDPPYGTERSYNGLRLAMAVGRQPETRVRVFLMGDAASCAKAGQITPQGYYNLERMVRSVAQRGGEVGVCGSCLDARGLRDTDLAEGARRSSMEELTQWTLGADQVIVF
jgi:uncharacterized protein involved in oxidation of intracellular sulfur